MRDRPYVGWEENRKWIDFLWARPQIINGRPLGSMHPSVCPFVLSAFFQGGDSTVYNGVCA